MFSDPYGGLADLARGVLRTPGHAGGVVRRRSAADAARRPVRRPRSALRVADDVRAAMTAMAGELGPDHRRAGAGRADQAAARRRIRGAGWSCSSTPGWPTSSCRNCRRCGWPPTSTASTRTSTPTPCRCSTRRSIWRSGGLAARPGAALGGAAARHRQAGHPAVRARRAGDASTTTRWSAPGWPASGSRRCGTPSRSIDDVAQLVFLHLRFYGYRDGEWTDSAVRRYVVDAGPLLPRLHKLVRSDCTTRNSARPPRWPPPTTPWRSGSRSCASRRSWTRSARTWTATRSWRILGIPPGPLVGQAYKHLLALRMEHGPLRHDEAVPNSRVVRRSVELSSRRRDDELRAAVR